MRISDWSSDVCSSDLMGIKEAAARMTAGGTIVNISSITAMRGFVQWGEYAATKAGIISLTQTAAVEYGPAGIRVNCVAPGIIDTPMRSEEHTSELQSLMRISYAVFCLKTKNHSLKTTTNDNYLMRNNKTITTPGRRNHTH